MNTFKHVLFTGLTVFAVACGGSGSDEPASSEGAADSNLEGGEASPSTGTTSGSTYLRRESLSLDDDGLGFTRTFLDADGLTVNTPPDAFVIEDGKVFTTKSFTSGDKDEECGAITVNDDAIELTGTCDLASSYDARDDGTFERFEQIDLGETGFTRTFLDASGSPLGAHPDAFVVEGGKVFTTKSFASGDEDEACGSITVTADAVEFEGTCGLFAWYEER